MKKFYLTKQETNGIWNYVGDPMNPNTTLDTGLITIEDRNEIKIDKHGLYVVRELYNPK